MKRDNTVPYIGRSRPLFTMPLPWSTTQATTITVNWGRWVRSTPWPGMASLSPRKLLTWKKSTRLFWNSRKTVIIALPLLTSFKRSSHMIMYFITGYIYTNMFIISLCTYCHQNVLSLQENSKDYGDSGWLGHVTSNENEANPATPLGFPISPAPLFC